MDVCWTDVPARHQLDKHRIAACHLYDDSPVMTGTDLSQVFVAP